VVLLNPLFPELLCNTTMGNNIVRNQITGFQE